MTEQLAIALLTGGLAVFGSWLGTKLGKDTEHDQWLRNQKLEKYTAYVNACKHIARVTRGIDANPEKFEESFATVSLIDAELVSSKKVKSHLHAFERAFYNYATRKGNDLELLEQDYTRALEDLKEAFREDLKIRD